MWAPEFGLSQHQDDTTPVKMPFYERQSASKTHSERRTSSMWRFEHTTDKMNQDHHPQSESSCLTGLPKIFFLVNLLERWTMMNASFMLEGITNRPERLFERTFQRFWAQIENARPWKVRATRRSGRFVRPSNISVWGTWNSSWLFLCEAPPLKRKSKIRVSSLVHLSRSMLPKLCHQGQTKILEGWTNEIFW